MEEMMISKIVTRSYESDVEKIKAERKAKAVLFELKLKADIEKIKINSKLKCELRKNKVYNLFGGVFSKNPMKTTSYYGKGEQTFYTIHPCIESPGYFWCSFCKIGNNYGEYFKRPMSEVGVLAWLEDSVDDINWEMAEPQKEVTSEIKCLTKKKDVEKEIKKVQDIDDSKSSVVYFIQAMGTNFVKIGRGKNRLGSIQCGCPLPLQLLREIKCVNARGLEKHLHDKFKEERHRGEWFNLSDNIKGFIDGQRLVRW